MPTDRAAIIIPARLNYCRRFPGKMLADIGGRPLVRMTAEAAARSGLHVHVSTDDHAVADVLPKGTECSVAVYDEQNGTERCALAASWLLEADIVINWQGDAPFIDPQAPHDLIAAIEAGATVASAWCVGDEEVQVLVDEEGWSLDFSRSVVTGKHHVGIYAFRRQALMEYATAPSAWEEVFQDLEQLRWGVLGHRLAMRETTQAGALEVNDPVDIAKVLAGSRRALIEQGVLGDG